PTSSCDALAIVCVCEGNGYPLIVPKSRYSLGKLRLSKSLPLHSRSRFRKRRLFGSHFRADRCYAGSQLLPVVGPVLRTAEQIKQLASRGHHTASNPFV